LHVITANGPLELGKGKGKGKVAPVLLLTEHHAMKAYWGTCNYVCKWTVNMQDDFMPEQLQT